MLSHCAEQLLSDQWLMKHSHHAVVPQARGQSGVLVAGQDDDGRALRRRMRGEAVNQLFTVAIGIDRSVMIKSGFSVAANHMPCIRGKHTPGKHDTDGSVAPLRRQCSGRRLHTRFAANKYDRSARSHSQQLWMM